MGTCPGCCSVPASFAVRTEAVLLQQKTKTRPRTVGAPAPGANGGLPVTQICARFVRGSHRGRCSYNKTKTAREPVGAPAPGANGACPGANTCPLRFAVRTGAVLLQQN